MTCDTLPYLEPSPHELVYEDDDDDESDEADEAFHTAYEMQPDRLTRSLETPIRRGHNSKRGHMTVSSDDRPITPMKDKRVYDIDNPMLDFKDGT